jgi:hypothetical protein
VISGGTLAKKLGCHRNSILGYRQRGRLKPVGRAPNSLGGWLYRTDDAERLIEERAKRLAARDRRHADVGE